MTFRTKTTIVILCTALIACTLFGGIASGVSITEPYYDDLDESARPEILAEAEPVISDYADLDGSKDMIRPAEDSHGYGKQTVMLGPKETAVYLIDVPLAGGYHISLDYFIPETSMQDLIVSLQINDEYQFYESRNLEFNAVWKDTSQEYKKDRSGNELYPVPERVFRWQQTVVNSVAYNSAEPYVYNLKKGINRITLTNNEVSVMFGDITLMPEMHYDTFEEYKSGLEVQTGKPLDTVFIIEGEKYLEKSDSFIRPAKSSDISLFPYDVSKKLINSLYDNSSAQPNQKVTYEFDVHEDGIYYIGFKYMQTGKTDMPSMKRLYIDDEILFEDLIAYPFQFTKTSVRNETLRIDGEEIPFWFTKGWHTLSVESTAGEYQYSYENLMDVINDIGRISLEIQYITGNRVDKNRNWKIGQYIPDLKDRLLKDADILDAEYDRLSSMTPAKNPVILSDLKVAADRLREFAADLNSLVNNISQLTSGDQSVNALISRVLPKLLNQPVVIDRIYIVQDTDNIPRPNVSFFRRFIEGLRKLAISFMGNEDEATATDKAALNVWVNHSTTNIEIQRELTETYFEQGKDYDINISIMPDEQKLLLAVSANNAPDAVIGLSYYKPYQFALRGAMLDLTQFEDFGDIIKNYNPEFFLPFTIGESCYAVPEALNFNLLYYRKDILEQLELEIPATWEDVIAMLPTLSRFGMSFSSQIGTAGSLKGLGSTSPYFSQSGSSIYSPDGTRTALSDTKAVEAFTLMTDLYTKYSMPETVANFYNSFRKGSIPLGIGDMSTYVLLRHAAPEIAGQWGIAPVIGVKDPVTGDIDNDMWAVNTSNVILADTDKRQEAWDYIKWYMSTDVQTKYVNSLQLTFGPEFIWASANLDAFSTTTSYPREHMEVMLEQLSHTSEIPLHPAYVIVEREISDAWNRVVFDGISPRTSLDRAITRANREIRKKLIEFGYIAEDGTLIKPYDMPTVETVLGWQH
ncbi:MAG: extracellular solute-binding protein [Saccharofermentanales bacterium]